MARILLLFLMIPASSWAWTLTDRCELTQETPKGAVTVIPGASGVLLYLPEGLVANDTLVTVSIGSRTWRTHLVGGAVELNGGAKPLLEKNWATVHADGAQVLGFNLSGSSAAWEKLQDCEPVLDGGGWVPLVGEIAASTDDEIISAIRRQRPEGLLLDSAGGLAEEAQRIGSVVREAGLATKVQSDGQCLSECTFILAAGIPRTVAANGRVGIPASLVTRGLGVFQGDQGSIAESAVYFSGMGVNGGRLAVLATSAHQDDIRILTPEELRGLGFVDTSAPKITTAMIARHLPGTGKVDWWLYGGGLGAIGALGWALTRFGRRT
jgi:hypothetical protein